MGGSQVYCFFPRFNKTPSQKRHSIGLVAVEAAPFDSNGKEEQGKTAFPFTITTEFIWNYSSSKSVRQVWVTQYSCK